MDDAAPFAQLPRLNLLAWPMLLGLCRRALSPAADAAQAALTARRIEHARIAQTELLKRISALKADVGITQDKALSAARSAQHTQLDWRLFEEHHPPPPAKRGLFQPKLSLAQQETERQRATLAALASQATQDAAEAGARAQQASRELLALEAELGASRTERSAYERDLRDQVGAWVLELLAAGQGEAARRTLADLRRNVRGDLIVGVLVVLTELFSGGPAAARQAITETQPVFEQHRDPAVRILEALLALAAAGGAGTGAPAQLNLLRAQPGLFVREQFTHPGLFRLYTVVCLLGGLGYAAESTVHDPLAGTYALLESYRQGPGAEVYPPQPEPPAAPPAGSCLIAPPDAWWRLLAANLWLGQDRCAQVLALVDFDVAAWQPPRRQRDPLPALWPLITAVPLPAWPEPLIAGVHSALACHVLLATHRAGPVQLAQAWLGESYGWPKDDFYWWTLSTLQNDPALLRNITGEPGQLFRLQPV